MEISNSNCFGFDTVQLSEGGQYAEYSKGGFYNWHMDIDTKMTLMPVVRKISMTLLLNDPKDYEGGDLIESVPALNNDSLFVNTALGVKNSILGTMSIPASLMGIVPDGFIFSAQQIADDYLFLTLKTKDIRNKIERQFEKLGQNLGKIVPNQFADSQMQETTNDNANTEGSSI